MLFYYYKSGAFMKRYLIAIDENGIHIRKNLCTIHHGETGEAEYHAKPICSFGRFAKIATYLIEIVGNFGARRAQSPKSTNLKEPE